MPFLGKLWIRSVDVADSAADEGEGVGVGEGGDIRFDEVGR